MEAKKETKNEVQNGKSKTGKVVSTGGTKTVIVEVVRIIKHPLYKKSIRKTRRFAAHNERTDIVIGDTVKIVEVCPISKTKHFLVVEKII